jgi:hypothetical protein
LYLYPLTNQYDLIRFDAPVSFSAGIIVAMRQQVEQVENAKQEHLVILDLRSDHCNVIIKLSK